MHAFGEFKFEAGSARLFDGNDAVLADPVECVCDQGTDVRVLARDSRNLSDLFFAAHLASHFVESSRDRLDCSVHAALEFDRTCTSDDLTKSFTHHCLSEHRGGGGAITCDVVCLGGNLFNELRAEVLVGIFKFDLTRDRHTIVSDGGCAPLLVDDDIASLWTERHLHGVG